MIVLDTNILSGLMQRVPLVAVVRWLDDAPHESIWTTTITIFEIRIGLDLLARGRRRRQMEDAFARTLAESLQGRVLPFDEQAAHEAARLAAMRRRAGRPGEMRDMQIAGIVSSRRATLATRNLRDFTGLGLSLVDPAA